MTEPSTKPLNIDEAINEYYKLKQKYEDDYREKYILPIIRNKKTNKKEKRVAFSRLPKPECINCKRNVGTIFSTKVPTEDLVKDFTVKCGDIQDPCPLDIHFKYALRDTFETLVNELVKNVDKSKLDIIKEKNNVLFFENPNDPKILTNFDKLSSNLKNNTSLAGSYIEQQILQTDNPARNEMIKKLVEEFNKFYIIPFKDMIKRFLDSRDELILNEAMRFYVEEMQPKLKEIQDVKYQVNFVEFNEDTGIYQLIQYKNSLQTLEYFFGGDDKIISFVKGVKKSKTKSKTMKTLEKEKGSKNKTRKLTSPEFEILEEEGEEIIEQEPEISPKIALSPKSTSGNISPDSATILENGDVMWTNPEYTEFWKRIPNKLKGILIKDKDWLEKYVHQCINARKNKQPCKMFLPEQTIFPPIILENGKYDFGSEVVNEVFNKQNKQYKEAIMSTVIEKYDSQPTFEKSGERVKIILGKPTGEKSYHVLKETLENLLEKDLDTNYTRGYY